MPTAHAPADSDGRLEFGPVGKLDFGFVALHITLVDVDYSSRDLEFMRFSVGKHMLQCLIFLWKAYAARLFADRRFLALMANWILTLLAN